MTTRVLPVLVTMLAALAALFLIGGRLLERDREALFDRFAKERKTGMEEAARGVQLEVADIGDDLELASTLLQKAETTELAERELHAIATIKREYLVMYARLGDGPTTRVTAFDAPPGVDALASDTLERMLIAARAAPGTLQVSAASSTHGPAAWYRVFARRPRDHGPTVAVVVDMAVVLGRIKLSRDATARLAVIDGGGRSAAVSDPKLARHASSASSLSHLVMEARRGASSVTTVGAAFASELGLPDATAVAIAVPLVVEMDSPWALLVVASTIAIQTQERTVVRRILVGGALVLVLLLSASAYVIRNSYRARALREQVRNAERLAHLTEKAEKILDHIPSGVLALSEDRRVTAVNRWLAERLGDDIVGRTFEQAFRTARIDDLAIVRDLVDRALATREPQSLRHEHIDLLGFEASLHVHAVPLAHKISDVSVLLVLDDLTEMRRIEQRLLHSEKLVTAGQLAAGIAHEVGTPLNVARGRVELTLSHLGNEHDETPNQQVAIEQIDRVTRLLQQLLDYVRPAPASFRDIELGGTLHAVTDLLAAQATKQQVALSVDVGPSLPTLRADPDQVQQIIINLVLNAIDACSRGGRVWLRARAREGGLVVEIEDDGQGIPREIQKQVFDPFFTTKKRGQGTGLGLWVVAQLVRAQSAEIELDSTPGQGTTARVVWQVT
ncbi:MAG: PAS domain-containing protein [Deltaproteobacteria bacterium]|nr:PAS domain-containing protein [Deltaproteobacteria bacterium]